MGASLMNVHDLIASWDVRRKETEERFRKYFPESDDMLAIVLRGHLLLEEFLDRLNRHCFHFPKYYDQARLSFSKKLLIARAQVLVPHKDPRDFFEPISKLNELRNNLAHNLDAPTLRSKVETFLASIEIRYTIVPKNFPKKASLEARLRAGIFFLLGQMEVLDNVVEFMEKSRQYGRFDDSDEKTRGRENKSGQADKGQ